MKNPYFYLYYRLYKFAKRVGTVDATWTAMLLVTALIYFNLSTIVSLFLPVEKILFFPIWIMAAIIALPLIAINYFIFVWRDKCFEIIKQFENESKSQKIISSILTIGYIALTWYLAHLD